MSPQSALKPLCSVKQHSQIINAEPPAEHPLKQQLKSYQNGTQISNAMN
jgi:hypothetical protein